MDEGQPVTLVAEAVAARMVSGLTERHRASLTLPGPLGTRIELSTDQLRDAAYAAKIISYAQGFMLLRSASMTHGWDLDLAAVASLWRGGCVIRARFLGDIAAAYHRDPELPNLLFDPFFADAVGRTQTSLRAVVAAAAAHGRPVPAYAAALSFYDGFRSARLPANLIQAQRDYFGAHTYERVDRPRGEFFHTDWTGTGGPVTSGSYTA